MSVKSVMDRKMSRQETGRRGGEKMAKERGSQFYRRIGRKGGKKVAEERGSEFFQGNWKNRRRKQAKQNHGNPNQSGN